VKPAVGRLLAAATLTVNPVAAPAVAPPGVEPKVKPKKQGPEISLRALPLLGSNQDSPDPEGPLKDPKLQQHATLYASSCHPMLELLGFILDFAVLYSHKCQSLLSLLGGASRRHGLSWRGGGRLGPSCSMMRPTRANKPDGYLFGSYRIATAPSRAPAGSRAPSRHASIVPRTTAAHSLVRA
jgi:hypothetical protein